MVDRFRVGVIQAPFGVHGEARIFVTSDDPNRFLSLKAVHAAPPEREAAFSSRGAVRSRDSLRADVGKHRDLRVPRD